MKGSNSFRTQQYIALYGKSARHPVCLAAFTLWAADAALSTLEKDIGKVEKTVNSAKEQKKQARVMLDQFYKRGMQKEAIQAAALVRKIGDLLTKMQTHYEAGVNLRSMLRESLPVLVAPFKREYGAAIRTGNIQALRALPRVQKRWNEKKVCLGNSARRTLEILKMLRDKVVAAAWAKGEARAGYLEAFRGGSRPLSDEVWQGRLTVREIYSRLMTVGGASLAGDKDGKEIRRTMRRLGIRPAEEQRGRKWQPPLPQKQEPKRPRGSPGTKPEIIRTGNLDNVQRASLDHRVNTTGYVLKKEYGKINPGNTSYGGLSSLVTSARKILKSIDRKIAKLQLLRGGRKGKFVY